MSLKYIRDYYRVPAYRGHLVKFRDEIFKIVSTSSAHLRVKSVISGRRIVLHPTWEVEYLGN